MGRINIAMLFFSKPKGEDGVLRVVDEKYWMEDTGEPRWGFQTNEAPLEDILLFLEKQGHGKIDRLYCLVTEKTVSEKLGGTDKGIDVIENGEKKHYDSHFDFWCERRKRLSPALDGTVIVPWLLKYEKNGNLVSTMQGQVAALADKIKSDYKDRLDKDEFHLYADITGGPRHANMLMTSVLRFLQYDKMHLEKMVYSDKNTFSDGNKVFDVLEIERLYTLIAGADAFIKYGSSAAIEEYFGYDAEHKMIPGKPDNHKLAAVLRDMRQFSDAIQICQPTKILQALGDLKESLGQFRDIPAGERTPEDWMFVQLLDTVWDGYEEIFPHDGQDKCDQYISIIRWCRRKGLLQQAMTFCTEWIPEYLVDRGICVPTCLDIAERATDKTHPGWRQNFIIRPKDYAGKLASNLVTKYKEQCDKAIDSALEGTVDMSQLPKEFDNEENKKLLEIISGINMYLRKLHFANGSNDSSPDAASEEVAETRAFLKKFVLNLLNKNRNGKSKWTLISLARDRNCIGRIRVKLKESAFHLWISGERPFVKEDSGANKEGAFATKIEKKWKAAEQNWRQMIRAGQIAVCPEDGEKAFNCLKAHYILREQRNQIMHATADNTISRAEAERLIDDCVEAIENTGR